MNTKTLLLAVAIGLAVGVAGAVAIQTFYGQPQETDESDDGNHMTPFEIGGNVGVSTNEKPKLVVYPS